MKRIERAVQKQTLSKPPVGSKTGCIPDEMLERYGRESVLGLLSKYIVFKDRLQPYWTDRYWYFDVEQYENDLQAFGIPMAVALKEPLHLPEP